MPRGGLVFAVVGGERLYENVVWQLFWRRAMGGNLSFLQTKNLGRSSSMNWKSALTAVACGLLALPSLGGAQSAKIKMGSSLSPPSLETITPYVAIEKGIFKKNGLDVEVVEFHGD